MSGGERVHALEAGLETTAGREPGLDERASDAAPFGGLVARAIRSQQLWLTVGYFAALLLLARAYS
jgi:hypothetical protein